MGDRTRLPKWAQAELSRLEANVEWWKGKASEGPADSDTFIQDHEAPKPLGKRTRIVYYLDGKQRIEVQLTKEGQLQVMSYGGSGGALHVIPQASNVVKIVTGDW